MLKACQPCNRVQPFTRSGDLRPPDLGSYGDMSGAYRTLWHRITTRRGAPAPVEPPARDRVRPQFDPPLAIVGWCPVPGGLVAVATDGAVYCEPATLYAGGANGKGYFAGQRAARIRAAQRDERVAGKVYVIESAAGGSYHFPDT